MRTVFVTLFLVFLSTSFAVKVGTQQKSLDLSKFKIQSNDFLGDAIKGLLQITALPETQEVIDIITEVRQELADLLRSTTDNYNADKKAYEDSRDTFEGIIRQLDSEIINTKAAIQEGENTQSQLEETIATSDANLRQAQIAYDAEVARREAASAAHAKKISDLTDAIAACEEALKLMAEVREKDLPATAAVFLQTSEQALKGHIIKINEKLSKLTLKSSITPFLKALVEMTQEGINWQLIDKIISLIQDLENSLHEEVRISNEADASDAEYSAKLLDSLHNTITTERVSLEQNGALLETVKGKVSRSLF